MKPRNFINIYNYLSGSVGQLDSHSYFCVLSGNMLIWLKYMKKAGLTQTWNWGKRVLQ